ncbi:MAG: NAD(P)-dependent oxidoreductase [Dehalococcoidia bacterium]|nr:NAD(P)-dependent oxidoreductase [Dehalococcoidia bacterium]
MGNLGVVGSGALGRAVCWRFLEFGHSVHLWGVDEEGMQECVASGAAPADSAAAVASRSEIVIVAADNVKDDETWELGGRGVVEGLSRGAVVIDMTTMSPTLARRISLACEEKGASFLDAPVSGGAPAARTGNLVIMVGGPVAVFNRVLPDLQLLSKKVVRIGETGAGATAKLCNQILCFVNLCGVCEAFTLASKAGIDLRKLLGVVSAGAAQSWELDNMGPKILDRELETGYPVHTSQEDLALVLSAASELDVFLPASALVHQLYHTVESEGLENSGSQSLIRALEKMAGTVVHG